MIVISVGAVATLTVLPPTVTATVVLSGAPRLVRSSAETWKFNGWPGTTTDGRFDAATLAFLTCGVTRRGFLQRFSQDEPPSSRNVTRTGVAASL